MLHYHHYAHISSERSNSNNLLLSITMALIFKMMCSNLSYIYSHDNGQCRAPKILRPETITKKACSFGT